MSKKLRQPKAIPTTTFTFIRVQGDLEVSREEVNATDIDSAADRVADDLGIADVTFDCISDHITLVYTPGGALVAIVAEEGWEDITVEEFLG